MQQIVDRYPSRTADCPSIMPRKDSVLWGGRDTPGPLSRNQMESFEENGFLEVSGVLRDREVLALRDELELLRRGRGRDRDPVVIAERGSGEVRSTFMIHAINKAFRRLSRHPVILGAVQQILADDVYIHQSRLNYKPAFEGKEFYWHSDFETWHVEDGMPAPRAVSCVVPLTPNYVFNGPMMMIPGSQRHYVACVGETPQDHYKTSLKKQEYGVPDQDSLAFLAEAGGIEMPQPQPGSILLFDSNTMHGSSANITPFARSNAFFVFNSLKNRIVAPFGGMAPRPEFVAARETIEPVTASDSVLA